MLYCSLALIFHGQTISGMILRLIFMFICSFYYAYPAKIIVFNPRFGYSHVNFMGRLADELQLAGHDVVS